MKIKPIIFFLALLITISCKEANAEKIRVITAAEMQDHLKYENMQVVDVQPKDKYDKSHLLNARNIIYDKDFRKNLETLDKTKPVAIYCTTGEESPKAAEILREAGFTNIYVLEGGIRRWKIEEGKSLK